MIYYSPSKHRDINNVYIPNTHFPVTSGRSRAAGKEESSWSLVDPKNYTEDFEELSWDEYGNPYIIYKK